MYVLCPSQVIKEGALFPPFSQIKQTSCHMMAHIMACMVREGSGMRPEAVPVQGPGSHAAAAYLPHCLSQMWRGPEGGPEGVAAAQLEARVRGHTHSRI